MYGLDNTWFHSSMVTLPTTLPESPSTDFHSWIIVQCLLSNIIFALIKSHKDEKTGLLTNEEIDKLASALGDKWEELAQELRHIESKGKKASSNF